jgi:hypothetical protein
MFFLSEVTEFACYILSDVTNIFIVTTYKAMQLLRHLVTVYSLQRIGFTCGSVHVGFVVEKVALGQVFV